MVGGHARYNLPGVCPFGLFLRKHDDMPHLGLDPPADKSRPGRSYAPLLDGKRVDWTDEVYFEYEYVRGIRTAGWKYVERSAEWPSELFDLRRDPSEHRNLASHPGQRERVAELRRPGSSSANQ